MSVPKTMKALVTQKKGVAAVQEIPVPTIDDDEILVKVVCVAQNPTDWKYIDNVGTAGTICGVDWSGVVVQVGSSVASPEIGDHVAGFTHGGTYTDRGAFAEYVKTPAELTWKVPKGTLTHEEASTFGCAFWTSAQALFHPTRLNMVEPPEKVKGEEWIFIYGGSSSVGMFAIQLAHVAGYKVVTVASQKNWDLCKSLGADAVFDYKDPEVVSKIKQVTKDSLHRGFDTISVAESQAMEVNAMAEGAGRIIVILAPQEAAKLRSDVIIQPTLLYTALGREFTHGARYPASPEDRKHMASFLKKVPDLVSAGAVKPNPVKLWEGGLEAINDGLQYMREGKVSGEKLVYRIASA